MAAAVNHGIVLFLVTALGTTACGDNVPQAPTGVGSTPVFATAPDFTGTWIGVSRLISCAGGCTNYPAGHERFLSFLLAQRGDEVTGNLSPVRGGPTVLPPVFWIAGRLASGTLTFQPMEVPGASGGLTSYTGEVMLTVFSPTAMLGRMTERSTRDGEPLTVVWEVRTSRQ